MKLDLQFNLQNIINSLAASAPAEAAELLDDGDIAGSRSGSLSGLGDFAHSFHQAMANASRFAADAAGAGKVAPELAALRESGNDLPLADNEPESGEQAEETPVGSAIVEMVSLPNGRRVLTTRVEFSETALAELSVANAGPDIEGEPTSTGANWPLSDYPHSSTAPSFMASGEGKAEVPTPARAAFAYRATGVPSSIHTTGGGADFLTAEPPAGKSSSRQLDAGLPAGKTAAAGIVPPRSVPVSTNRAIPGSSAGEVTGSVVAESYAPAIPGLPKLIVPDNSGTNPIPLQAAQVPPGPAAQPALQGADLVPAARPVFVANAALIGVAQSSSGIAVDLTNPADPTDPTGPTGPTDEPSPPLPAGLLKATGVAGKLRATASAIAQLTLSPMPANGSAPLRTELPIAHRAARSFLVAAAGSLQADIPHNAMTSIPLPLPAAGAQALSVATDATTILPRDIGDQVSHALRQALPQEHPGQTSRLRIRLQPESLGTIEAEIIDNQGSTRIHLMAESDAVAKVLRESMSLLRDQLGAGNPVVITVHTQDSQGRGRTGGEGGAWQQDPERQADAESAEPEPSPGRRYGTDTFVFDTYV